MLISICAGSILPAFMVECMQTVADYSELKTGNRATGLIFSSSSMKSEIWLGLSEAPLRAGCWLFNGFEAKRGAGRGSYSWNKDVPKLATGYGYGAECHLYQPLSAFRERNEKNH